MTPITRSRSLHGQVRQIDHSDRAAGQNRSGRRPHDENGRKTSATRVSEIPLCEQLRNTLSQSESAVPMTAISCRHRAASIFKRRWALKMPSILRIQSARRYCSLGSEDRTSTSSMVKAMYRKHSRATIRTDIHEFPNRSRWLIAEPGWEEVAEKGTHMGRGEREAAGR